MSRNTWIQAIIAEFILIMVWKILMPFYYFISSTMSKMGAPAQVGQALTYELEMGFWFMAIAIIVIAIVADNFKREELSLEY